MGTVLNLALEEAATLRRDAEHHATHQMVGARAERIRAERVRAERVRGRLEQERRELAQLRVAAHAALRAAHDDARRLLSQDREQAGQFLAEARDHQTRMAGAAGQRAST